MLDKDELQQAPATAGVYRFLDHHGRTLYVGKAKNLSDRLSHYVYWLSRTGSKTKLLLNEASKVVWVQTESEIESLILEASLIKKLRPKYNVSLKDDKFYSYVWLERFDPASSAGSYPRLRLVRRKVGSGQFFGPFPTGYQIKSLMRLIRRTLPYRDCDDAKFHRFRRLGHGCLLENIKLCPAPCVLGRISPQNYRQNLRAIRAIFKGRSREFIQFLEEKMRTFADKLEFEEAQRFKLLKEKIEALGHSRIRPEEYQDNPNLYQDLRRAELQDLQALLKPYFPKIDLIRDGCRIEAFDISNLGSSGFVGAQVVWLNGSPETSAYRRYKIRSIRRVNDAAMMAEIVGRRLQGGDSHRPDLIIIDGGVSQLSAIRRALGELDLPIAGLAKRRERLVVGKEYLTLPKSRPGLQLLRRLRDEVHRFVLAYQRRLRRLSLL